VTKSTPYGAADQPVDPATFAMGCAGSFIARSIDTEANHLSDVLRRAATHKGTAFIEIYQNCNVFNDGAFDAFKEKDVQDERTIRVEHGAPLLFGAQKHKGLRIDPRTLALEVVTLGENGVTDKDVILHDETNATLAYMLARMPFPTFPVALGVLYAVQRPTYEGALVQQREAALKKHGPGDLKKLLFSGNTWTV
jgi:2-oxoglutarate ferredoxin oxidoreductase subunit beta